MHMYVHVCIYLYVCQLLQMEFDENHGFDRIRGLYMSKETYVHMERHLLTYGKRPVYVWIRMERDLYTYVHRPLRTPTPLMCMCVCVCVFVCVCVCMHVCVCVCACV